jgi:protein SCO1/2
MRGLAIAAALACGSAGAAEPAPFPVEIRAVFDLVDQHGNRRTDESLRGGPLLLFFGFARCESICGTALPALAETTDLLAQAGYAVTPVMITIDPQGDTPEALAEAAPDIHPRLIALTGDGAALARARDAFQVQVRKLFEAPDGAPVYAHGAFIYLIGPDGRVLTLLPPVMDPQRMAEVAAGYL